MLQIFVYVHKYAYINSSISASVGYNLSHVTGARSRAEDIIKIAIIIIPCLLDIKSQGVKEIIIMAG